ncbi:MAG TPA: hypothetical protein DEP42_04905 [Ruminococcaceae bacterium]|nr:hypothetical protein [Oscillospiraceae bacterium]
MNITSILLDGLELADKKDYYFHFSGTWDFEKDVTTNDTFNDGSTFVRSKNKPKTLSLEGFILRDDETLQTKLNAVLSTNRMKTIIINRQYRAQVELTSRGSSADDSRSITIALTMPEPYWYSQKPDSVELGTTYSTGVIFGNNHNVVFGENHGVIFGTSTGAAGIVTNLGNVDAYPIITIVGECSGILIKNETTGESIQISATLELGDTLIIDCSAGTNSTRGIYLNGISTLTTKTTVGWIHCIPGRNAFSFARYSLENKKHCTVQLHSRWI